MSFFFSIKSVFSAQKQALLKVCSISFVIAALDLLTKGVVFSMQTAGVYICGIFNILKVKNYGVSFGILNDNHHSFYVYLIIVLEILIVLFLLYSLKDKKNYKKPRLFVVAIALTVGGAIGNIIDRIMNGYVRDFLDFHIGDYHWPCFNVADVFVCLGVFSWIICEIFFRKKGGFEK